jgi:hypothetical protein
MIRGFFVILKEISSPVQDLRDEFQEGFKLFQQTEDSSICQMRILTNELERLVTENQSKKIMNDLIKEQYELKLKELEEHSITFPNS